MKRLVVINPNCTTAVTKAISEAIEPLREPGLEIDCLTLEGAPPGIILQQHVDCVVPSLLDLVRQEADRADAYVIACYSDPGVFAAREVVAKPVFGAAQCTLGFAATIGSAVGVISLKPQSVARHLAHARSMGLRQIIVGDRSANVTIEDLAGSGAGQKLIAAADDLVQKDGADVIALGCCGMSRFRSMIEARIGLPVLDPTQIAVGLAITAIKAGYETPPRGGRS